MKQAKMPYETVFRAPLEIENGVATLSWLKNDKGFQLDGRNIDVKAKAVRARGGFRYLQPTGDEPWLGILAGISTDDGSQAWRYFPENLMGKALVDYLSGLFRAVKRITPRWCMAVTRICSRICTMKGNFRSWCRYVTRPLLSSPTGLR
jgi:uncharacterized protein YhdP